jgi:hypothetical protein
MSESQINEKPDMPCASGICVGLLASSRKALDAFFVVAETHRGDGFVVNMTNSFHDLDAFAHYGDPKTYVCRFKHTCQKCWNKEPRKEKS